MPKEQEPFDALKVIVDIQADVWERLWDSPIPSKLLEELRAPQWMIDMRKQMENTEGLSWEEFNKRFGPFPPLNERGE